MSNFHDSDGKAMEIEGAGPLGTRTNPILIADDDDPRPRLDSAAVDAGLVDLTMEDEDEIVPFGFWAKTIEAKRSVLYAQRIDVAAAELHEQHAKHFQLLMSSNPDVTREAPGSKAQQLVVPIPPACCYAFVDSIEYRHLGEQVSDDLSVQEQAYDDDWPPRDGYEAMFTLDCYRADTFLAILAQHQSTFAMLYGQTLTKEKIDARNALLRDLLSDPSQSCIVRIIIGSSHEDYVPMHELLPELQWRKIWVQTPTPGEQASLWDLLTIGTVEASRSWSASDLYTDWATPAQLWFDDITQLEVAYLEEVFSLNHIPDAPLPPAVPVPGIPDDPLQGFDFLSNGDPYWSADLPPQLRTTIAPQNIRASTSAAAHDLTTDTRYDIRYVKKDFLVLYGLNRTHTLLFFKNGVSVSRMFDLEDPALSDSRFEFDLVAPGSLLSPDRLVVSVRDRNTGQLFIGRRLFGRYRFITLEHIQHIKTGVE